MNPVTRTAAILATAAIALSGCHFSPWGANTTCRDRYEDNLDRLRDREASAPATYTVALLSDTHSWFNDMATVVDRINRRHDPEFVLVLGDVTDGGLATEYEWACDGLSKLHAPTFYSLGNHDALSFGPEIFKDVFGPFNLAFTYAGTRFILYNDNAYEFPNVPDYGWLAREAELEPGEVRNHTVGVSHIPPKVDAHDQAEIDELLAFLDAHEFGYTVHGHTHEKDLFTDIYGNQHLVVDSVEGGKYALMRVSPMAITFQHCGGVCQDAEEDP